MGLNHYPLPPRSLCSPLLPEGPAPGVIGDDDPGNKCLRKSKFVQTKVKCIRWLFFFRQTSELCSDSFQEPKYPSLPTPSYFSLPKAKVCISLPTASPGC